MRTLPISLRYCHNQIAGRFLTEPSSSEALILAIPGGPCLSGRYLDDFLISLSQHVNINVGILDLPNHGESMIQTSLSPLAYGACLELIDATLNEISKQCSDIILFGQSFGARLAFDVLSISDVVIRYAMLTGFPYVFEMSTEMQSNISALLQNDEPNEQDPERQFQKIWEKMLPLYTYSSLPNDVFKMLTADTRVKGNERLLDQVPPITTFVERYQDKKHKANITIVQGDFDGVVPDGNLAQLKSLLPQAKYIEISGCGHFPMVEKPEELLNAFKAMLNKLT